MKHKFLCYEIHLHMFENNIILVLEPIYRVKKGMPLISRNSPPTLESQFRACTWYKGQGCIKFQESRKPLLP